MDICAKCKGACCKHYPGTMVPEDVPNNNMLVAVQGDYIFDWWIGDPRSEDASLLIRSLGVISCVQGQ